MVIATRPCRQSRTNLHRGCRPTRSPGSLCRWSGSLARLFVSRRLLTGALAFAHTCVADFTVRTVPAGSFATVVSTVLFFTIRRAAVPIGEANIRPPASAVVGARIAVLYRSLTDSVDAFRRVLADARVADIVFGAIPTTPLATIVTTVLVFAIGNAARPISEAHFLLAASAVVRTRRAVLICVLIAKAISAGRCGCTHALGAVVVLGAVATTSFAAVVPAVLAVAVGLANAKPFDTVLLRPLAGSAVATTAVLATLCDLARRNALALPLNAAHLSALALPARATTAIAPALDAVAVRQAACPIFEACLAFSAAAVEGARIAVFAYVLLAKVVAAPAQRLALAFLAGGAFKAIAAASFAAIISALFRVASHEDAQCFDALLATTATTIIRTSGAVFAVQRTALSVPAEDAVIALVVYAARIRLATAISGTTAARFSQRFLAESIPAGFLLAQGRATVAALRITIVALLPFLGDAVPTFGRRTRFAFSLEAARRCTGTIRR